MDCSELIMSEDVMDFIFESAHPLTYENGEITGETCNIQIDNNWMVGYARLAAGSRMNVADIGYYPIPKLYGIMDTTSMDASGITATLNQPFLNVQGQGVLIGFIDTGIDYTLDIFKFNTLNTKIGVIWDQSIQGDLETQDASERQLREQLGNNFPYGTMYTKEKINEALRELAAGNDPYNIVPSRDEIGHGTYIAGIAAAARTEEYTGAAPEAEIAVVKLKPAKQYLRDFFLIKEDAKAFEENDIMQGVKFLQDYAGIRRMPLVICFCMGTGSGPRTGATPLGSVLDTAARRPDVVVVTCVGNEANARTHVSGVARSEREPAEIEISVGANEQGFAMEIWASTLDVLSISLTSPSGENIARIPARARTSNVFRFLLENSEVTVDYRIVEPIAGYEVVFLRFIRPAEGIWRINVYSLTNIIGSFNAWLPLRGFMSSDTHFLQSVPETTLTEPSAANWLISVGAYDHVTGASFIDSGRGYTADMRVKPDIAAPGVNVYGPKAGGGYTYRSGTSAAAAHVAGAAALLLTWGVYYGNAPYMQTSDVKYILIRGAARDGGMEYPNNILGYGKMNLINSFVQLRVT